MGKTERKARGDAEGQWERKQRNEDERDIKVETKSWGENYVENYVCVKNPEDLNE